MTSIKHLMVAAAFLAMVHATMAGQSLLLFDQPTMEFHPEPGITEVTADFTFTNSSDQPIKITNVETGCGCTTAKLPKQAIQPGESEILAIKYHFTPRGGISTRSISVFTDESDADPVFLTIKVQIPEILKLSKRYVTWQQNGEASRQVVDIKLDDDSPVAITDIKLNKLGSRSKKGEKEELPFIVELKEIDSDTADYQLTIWPTDLSQPIGLEVRLITDLPADNEQRVVAFYAHILPARDKRDQ